MNQAQRLAPAVLRIGLSLVFLWFSLNQFFFVNDFVNLIPEWLVSASGMSPAVFVIGNAFLEFVLGMFLILGIHVRFSAFILSVHLVGIAFSLGYGALMIRDLGLAIATFSVFLQGADAWCVQKKE